MNLIEKIDTRSAKIGVIGLGYVGLPLAMEFANAGYEVVGIDIDKDKVDLINNGKNYIKDVDSKLLKKAVANGMLTASVDFNKVKDLDSLSICVPTPLNKQKDPDISYIVSVMEKIDNHIHPNMIITLESTTYPGSTKELILPHIIKAGFTIGADFFLCFSPERIDPGNQKYKTSNTPKVIGGITNGCTEIGKFLYNKIINKIITVSSTETAEMVKLLENTFRAINIGLANEIAIMCEKLGVNAWEVIDAAATKPFGYMKFTPGPGLGGHCIPIDPHYLSWKLKKLDYDARFIQLAGEINTGMPNHIFNMISENLNAYQKTINGSKILIIGVSYKKDIDDVRESPALDIIQLLANAKAKIDYYDPHVPILSFSNISLKSLNILKSSKLNTYDVCVIITDHTDVDYEKISQNSQLIIDSRNVFKNDERKNIKRLGQG
jgi:UDP-N-acetyl-D-glucosamine dehydrogenase